MWQIFSTVLSAVWTGNTPIFPIRVHCRYHCDEQVTIYRPFPCQESDFGQISGHGLVWLEAEVITVIFGQVWMRHANLTEGSDLSDRMMHQRPSVEKAHDSDILGDMNSFAAERSLEMGGMAPLAAARSRQTGFFEATGTRARLAHAGRNG